MKYINKKGAAAIAGMLSVSLVATGCSATQEGKGDTNTASSSVATDSKARPVVTAKPAKVATPDYVPAINEVNDSRASVASHLVAVDVAVDEAIESVSEKIEGATYNKQRTTNLLVAGSNLADNLKDQAEYADQVANRVYEGLVSGDQARKSAALGDLHTLWSGVSVVYPQPSAPDAFRNVQDFLAGGEVPNIADVKALVDYFIVKNEIPVPTINEIETVIATNLNTAHEAYHSNWSAPAVNNGVGNDNRDPSPKSTFDPAMADFYTNLRAASENKDEFIESIRSNGNIDELRGIAKQFDAMSQQSINLLIAGGMTVAAVAAIIADSVNEQIPDTPRENDAESTPNIDRNPAADVQFPDNSVEVVPEDEAPAKEETPNIETETPVVDNFPDNSVEVVPEDEAPAEDTSTPDDEAPVEETPAVDNDAPAKEETPNIETETPVVDNFPDNSVEVVPEDEAPAEDTSTPDDEAPVEETPAVDNEVPEAPSENVVTPPVPQSVNDQIAADIYSGINEYRVQNGLAELTYSAELEAGAQNQANAMAQAQMQYHSSVDELANGKMEIIASNRGDTSGEEFLDKWKGSVLHDRTMLDDTNSEYGVGVATGENDRTYSAVQFR